MDIGSWLLALGPWLKSQQYGTTERQGRNQIQNLTTE
jgi:hypothetical protein